jgi:hypothetical protein
VLCQRVSVLLRIDVLQGVWVLRDEVLLTQDVTLRACRRQEHMLSACTGHLDRPHRRPCVLPARNGRTIASRRVLPSRRPRLLRRSRRRTHELRSREDLRAGSLRQTVSTTRIFDELARTLAEPMPRRRAVRVSVSVNGACVKP